MMLSVLRFALAIFFAAITYSSASKIIHVIVVDGDTIIINDITYRLHGIDAPEDGQKCSKAGGGTWPCGKAATAALQKLISPKTEGWKPVKCEGHEKDDFGRVIARCTASGVDINRWLVENGYAWAFRKFSTDYVPAEDIARKKRLGIWQAITQTAEEFRAERWNIGLQIAPAGCPIKGNISKNGRIYHAPWSPWYNRTKINESKGERWFCSEAAALAAGWRAPIWGK